MLETRRLLLRQPLSAFKAAARRRFEYAAGCPGPMLKLIIQSPPDDPPSATDRHGRRSAVEAHRQRGRGAALSLPGARRVGGRHPAAQGARRAGRPVVRLFW